MGECRKCKEGAIGKFGGSDSGDEMKFACGGYGEEFDVVDGGGCFVGTVGLDGVAVSFGGVKSEAE